jgi:hypothetical protein
MERLGAYGTEMLEDGSSVFRTFESAGFTFNADCDPADARWAFQHPEFQEPVGDRHIPLRQVPTPGRAAIAALDDAAVTIEFSRAITTARCRSD